MRTQPKIKRSSPSVDGMQMVKDKDGTVWAFVSPAQRNRFESNRKALEKKSHNFLSKREILSQLYGGSEL